MGGTFGKKNKLDKAAKEQIKKSAIFDTKALTDHIEEQKLIKVFTPTYLLLLFCCCPFVCSGVFFPPM